jgi:hypothetical protein
MEPYGSVEHSGGESRASKKSAFEYFRNLEEYPIRYRKYCSWIKIVHRTENTITTREFWNITLDSQTTHKVISVRYEFIPYSEIRYEILEGYAEGIKNKLSFRDSVENPEGCIIELALPILDIAGHPYTKNSMVYQDLWFYLKMKNMEFLEKMPFTMFALGQKCINCKKGKLIIARLGNSTELQNYKIVGEQFECDVCSHRHYNNFIFSRDGVNTQGTLIGLE